MPMVQAYFTHLLQISLEASPWLLFGLAAAGLIKALIPDQVLLRWVGKGTFAPVARAAVIGAPLPLCSCGVIPAAVGLRRQGASPGATVSFLVATPETGADSIAISYAMLGPFLMIARPVAAIVSALLAGLACEFVAMGVPVPPPAAREDEPTCQSAGCCSNDQPKPQTECSCEQESPGPSRTIAARVREGLIYAATDLANDLALWLLIGLVLAAAVATFLSPTTLATYATGVPAMLLVALLGVPMYICATESTPLAAAMLLAGVSPGTVLVFLLAGPATNIATIALIRKELGTTVVAVYLTVLVASAIGLGVLTDLIVRTFAVDMPGQMASAHELIPRWIAWVCLALLLIVMIRPLRRRLLGR